MRKDQTYCFVLVTGKTKVNISVASRATQSGTTLDEKQQASRSM